MRRFTRRERRILVTFVLSLMIGIPYLLTIGTLAKSVIAYAKIEDVITANKRDGDEFGWTDERTAEGKAAKERRSEMANEDPVIGFLDATRENKLYNIVRYIVGFVLLGVAVLTVWIQVANGRYLFKEHVVPELRGAKRYTKLMLASVWRRMQYKRHLQTK